MNQQHRTTFIALFKLLGLSEEGSQELGTQMGYIDNDIQDKLIALLTSELAKR